MRVLRLLSLLVALVLLGVAVRPLAAEEPKPPAETPKKSGDPAGEPAKPADPKPDEPKPGEPKPGDPKPGEPAPEGQPAPAPKAEGPPGETPEEKEAREMREEEQERKRREEQQAKAAGEDNRPPPPEAPRPGPPGMCYVPAGEAVVGSTAQELAKLLQGRSPDIQRLFAPERPQHKVAMGEYWIDRTEVTNGQYYQFLKESTVAYICDGKLPTLLDVAGELLQTPKPKEDEVAWRQLAEANKDALTKALPNVAWPQGFRDALLPKKDLVLTFVKRRPPDDWPGMAPAPERLNHPVRNVSCLDAEAFCEWAGKHLVTEEEFEYAGRGPEGFTYPWGNVWHDDKELLFCNWGARNVNPATHAPDTWVVGWRPRGRSWVGAVDMLGNVAEWTSVLQPYDEKQREDPKMPREWFGAVRVIKGATAVDQEQAVLRLAYRNFVGDGFNHAPPYVQNRYAWVGFRCAWYQQPGRNQAAVVIERLNRGGRLKKEEVATDALAGSVAENFNPEGKDGVWVNGRAKAVLLLPRRFVVNGDVEAAKDKDAINLVKIKTKSGLLSESATEHPRLILGGFHTDVPLAKVGLRMKVKPPANEEERKEREKEEKKKRGRNEAPATEEGTCAPGSYLLMLWHGRLALCDASMEFVCFLTPAGKQVTLDVRKLKDDEKPVCKVAVDDTVQLVNGQFMVPLLTGKGSDAGLWVTGSFSVDAPAQDIESPNGWR